MANRFLSASVLALAALTAVPASAATVAAVTLNNTPATVVETSIQTFGWAFRAEQDLDVVGLGSFDHLGDGFTNWVDVGLYTATGTLLASTRIGAGAGTGTLVDDFRFVDIAKVSLQAGLDYIIGAFSPDQDTFFNANYGAVGGGRVSLTADPRISLLGARDTGAVAELTFPGRVPPTCLRNPADCHLGSFGPNLLIADPVAAVPVPAGLPLLAGALATFGLLRRRR